MFKMKDGFLVYSPDLPLCEYVAAPKPLVCLAKFGVIKPFLFAGVYVEPEEGESENVVEPESTVETEEEAGDAEVMEVGAIVTETESGTIALPEETQSIDQTTLSGSKAEGGSWCSIMPHAAAGAWWLWLLVVPVMIAAPVALRIRSRR
jgi:hypothetical protein